MCGWRITRDRQTHVVFAQRPPRARIIVDDFVLFLIRRSSSQYGGRRLSGSFDANGGSACDGEGVHGGAHFTALYCRRRKAFDFGDQRSFLF